MTLGYDDDFGKATRPSGKHDVPDSQRAERHQASTPPAIWPLPARSRINWHVVLWSVIYVGTIGAVAVAFVWNL